jgi:hypothetical protein
LGGYTIVKDDIIESCVCHDTSIDPLQLTYMRTSHWYTINTKVVDIHINYPTITPKPNTTMDHLNRLYEPIESHSRAT